MLTFIVILLTSCEIPKVGRAPAPTPTPTPVLPAPTAQPQLWQKYQTELARTLFDWYSPKYGFPSGLYKSAVCEWDILGRADHLVYVWVYCGVPGSVERDVPAVVYLNDNGHPQKAEAPGPDTHWSSDVSGMFPADVQAKFDVYTGDSLFSGRLQEMIAHAKYRYTHPGEPPLIIVDSVPF